MGWPVRGGRGRGTWSPISADAVLGTAACSARGGAGRSPLDTPPLGGVILRLAVIEAPAPPSAVYAYAVLSNLCLRSSRFVDSSGRLNEESRRILRAYGETSHFRLVALRDGWQCFYCGVKVHAPGRFVQENFQLLGLTSNRPLGSIDHVIPRALGGPDILSNEVIACLSCNAQKRDRPFF